MFNALSSEDLLTGVGRVLRTVANARGALEEYERSQALSAYSVTRLLAAEQAAAPELLRHTKHELLEALEADAQEATVAEHARVAIGSAETGVEIGDAVSDLLAQLPRSSAIRARVHGALAEMVDREVAALAAARR
jgi:hypothetical protein